MENRQDYEFTKTNSLDNAYLGDPFNLDTMTPDALLNYNNEVPVASDPQHFYQHVVFSGHDSERNQVYPGGDHMDGKWQAVSTGLCQPGQVPGSGQAELAC